MQLAYLKFMTIMIHFLNPVFQILHFNSPPPPPPPPPDHHPDLTTMNEKLEMSGHPLLARAEPIIKVEQQEIEAKQETPKSLSTMKDTEPAIKKEGLANHSWTKQHLQINVSGTSTSRDALPSQESAFTSSTCNDQSRSTYQYQSAQKKKRGLEDSSPEGGRIVRLCFSCHVRKIR
jgi:hypothetical protein